LFPVLRGLGSFYGLRSDYEKAAEMGQRILDLAERLDDIDMRIEGLLVVGVGLSFVGENPQLGLARLLR
jgi:hypothetical protein